MTPNCCVCGQRTELEPGFYHGTGYVSYALTVGYSIITFTLWILITHIGLNDKRVFWWLTLDIVSLIALQPWLMRVSRLLWLSWFFHDDDRFFENNIPTIGTDSENPKAEKNDIIVLEKKYSIKSLN